MSSSTSEMDSISVLPLDAGDTGSGPKRGRRPLEVPEGGSVTNRRRIQNRMAQRAYRQRKESAIDVLKQKVEELERSKEDMGREFINFTSVILQQDIVKNNPQIIEHIKQTTISLLSSAREVDENERPDVQDGEQNDLKDLPLEVSPDLTPPIPQAQDFDFPMMDGTGQIDYTTNPIDPMLSQQRSNSDSTPHSFDATSYFQLPTTQTPFYDMTYQLPGSTWDSTLPNPRSYASQELNFGRRYHRASQEAAFLLASMRHAPPAWYRKVFGFCMHFETREEICSRIGETLRKSKEATLNNWKFPFTNTGGAGTFFPEQGYGAGDLPIGNRSLEHEAYRPTEMSGFSMGPFGPSVEQIRDLRLNPQLRIIDPEYDGDFFDSDEIEICLRGYGVTIPSGKDFVTAYIDMSMFERTSDSETSSGPTTPPDMPGNGNFVEEDLESDEPPSFSCPAGLMGMAMGAMPPPPKEKGPGEQWKTPSKRETKVKIDVERLIMCLVNSTVCLGRTPAVRPIDIRKSLKMSIIQEE
ncbi:hypothetical protein FCIRC_6949 [Fusarium circinatum]|uniref:BZIP domain-containing protein n=1 Tax=Fusarium circinatum TaxID=48490 RepID=A0A8H5X0E9_FUSCI|nr:hypothetical protein FCIRC_6949 [Fusarium circinatum]